MSQPYIAQILAASKSRFVPRSRLGQVLVSRRAQVIDIVRSYGAENVVVSAVSREATTVRTATSI